MGVIKGECERNCWVFYIVNTRALHLEGLGEIAGALQWEKWLM